MGSWLCFSSALAPAAPQPYLVKNINRVHAEAPGPASFFLGNLDDVTLFAAADREHGDEPWVSDGTVEGTSRLADLTPGPMSSSPRVAARLGDRLIFAASPDGGNPTDLWSTDGTTPGTLRLAEGLSVGKLAGPESLTPGGALYLAASDDERGSELWATDGTAAGTHLVRDIAPGPTNSSPAGWVAVDGRVLFTATQPDSGRELWVTDGTPVGTRLVRDIDPGPASGFDPFAEPDCGHEFLRIGLIGQLAPLGGQVLFVAADGEHGAELWRSDGTEAGTRLVADLTPGTASTRFLSLLVPGEGRVYFFADAGQGWQLWSSDGTAAGTRPLTAFTGNEALPVCQFPDHFGAVGTAVYFVKGYGTELWVSDGTPEGTRLLPGSPPYVATTLPRATAHGLLFSALDEDHGYELWTTDGTAAGTRRLADLCPGECWSFPDDFSDVGDTVVFHTIDGDIWRTDGTADGTVEIAEASAPTALFPAVGDRSFLLFNRFDGAGGVERWRTDGTAVGTLRLGGPPAPSDGDASPAQLTPVGEDLYFSASDGIRSPLWRTDGTEAGTVQISPPDLLAVGRLAPVGDGAISFLAFREGSDSIEWWRSAGGESEFLVSIGAHYRDLSDFSIVDAGGQLFLLGPSLWKSDGTAAGTVYLRSFVATGSWAARGGELFFAATRPDGALELWKSDGTKVGTAAVCADEECEFSRVDELHVVQGRLVFVADSGSGRRLWSSDGTPDGTRPIGGGAAEVRDPYGLTVVGARLVFFATGAPANAPSLWASDGTAEGTEEIAEVAADDPLGRPPRIAVLPGRVCFLAATDLWCTDGSRAGTVFHAGLVGAERSIEALWPAGDRLALAVRGGLFTFELWLSDLTAAGTVLLADLTSPLAVPLTELAVAGTRVFYPATELATGLELWAVDLPSMTPCAPAADVVGLRSGRFAVRACWRDQHNGRQGVAEAAPLPGLEDAGAFWFFGPDNVELVVKILDGGAINGHFWFFYGALTDVEYWITVTDTSTGGSRTYYNPPGQLCSRGDTEAFLASESVGGPAASHVPRTPRAGLAAPALPLGGTGPCIPDARGLCLAGGRYRVEVDWHDQHNGGDGAGTAIRGTDESGYFWFFNPANVELAVKVLDGTPVNGHVWVFYGALSDVGYTIRVTDTETGAEKLYVNPPGNICGRADTEAF